MSEIMLNLRDASRAIHTTLHGSEVDYFVAALSADPETIEELEWALKGFMPKGYSCAHWRSGMNTEPWDAGLGIIDLAARMVVMQSTYSCPPRAARNSTGDSAKGTRPGEHKKVRTSGKQASSIWTPPILRSC